VNALIAVILGAITVYLTYTRYARRIDRNVIQSDPLFDQEMRGQAMLGAAA